MSDELAKVERSGLVKNFDEAARAANAMAQSGYFSDAKEASQAMVKVLAGYEMGFGPFASMTGIHVIKGKPTVGANLMAAAVKGHPSYNYRVKQMDDTAVVVEFFENDESIGVSSFSKDDATKAGTQNMGKFPRNMLFARAMSNGVKWFCPDVFAGSAVYTPGELESGDYVDAPVSEIGIDEIAATHDTQQEEPQIRYAPHALKAAIAKSVDRRRAEGFAFPADKPAGNYRTAIVGNLEQCFADESDKTAARHAVLWFLTGKKSSKELDDAEIKALHVWLNATPDDDDNWHVDEDACKEAHAVYVQALKEQGQGSLFDE